MPERCPFKTKLYTMLSILLVPFVVLYATQVVWMQDPAGAFLWMIGHPAASGLFWLLYSIPAMAVFGLCRRLFPAYWLGFCLFMGVAVSSRVKYDILGAPLQLSDFAMLGKLGDITGFAGAKLIPSLITLLAVALVAVLSEVLRRKKCWRPPVPPCFVLGSLCLFIFLSAFQPGVLQNAAMRLDEGCRTQEDRCQQEGVVLGIYAAWSQRQALANETFGSDVEEMVTRFQEEAAAPVKAADMALPDIIFITSESFFDVTRLPNLTFEKDPLPTYHRLCKTCTDGRFLTNTYGGGTGHVEMELFTGLTSYYLREGDTLNDLNEDAYRTLPTTVRLLRQTGYETVSVHSHNSVLYHREEIYPAIGFDELVFIDDFMTPPEYKGPYVSDDSFAAEVIARYEARDPKKPCFLYGMTMENHQAYSAEKFGEPSGYPAESDLLNEEDLEIVDALVYGLRDADQSLKRLTDYFSKADRPVLLVFAGDHRPSIGTSGEESLYGRLGCIPFEDSSTWDLETYRAMQSTDYLIWSNYEETQTVPDRDESCTFLGLHVLERAGVPLNAYFRWLDRDVASWMTIDRGRLFVDSGGASYEQAPEEMTEIIERYAAVERGLLYGIS